MRLERTGRLGAAGWLLVVTLGCGGGGAAQGSSGGGDDGTCAVGSSLSAAEPTTETAGVVPGSTLTGCPTAYYVASSGDCVLNVDGGSISNVHVTGSLYLAANDVTATNVQVDGVVSVNGAPGGNYFYPVKTRQTLVHVDAHGLGSVGLSDLTVDRCRFHGVTGAIAQLTNYQDTGGDQHFFAADGLVVTNSMFDDLATVPAGSGYHLEALHLLGVVNAKFCNDVFDARTDDATTLSMITAAFTQQDRSGVTSHDVLLDGNYFLGGGYYQVYLYATNMTVTNNHFTSYTAAGGTSSSAEYPPSSYPGSYPTFTQSGNTLDGVAYSLPGGG